MEKGIEDSWEDDEVKEIVVQGRGEEKRRGRCSRKVRNERKKEK